MAQATQGRHKYLEFPKNLRKRKKIMFLPQHLWSSGVQRKIHRFTNISVVHAINCFDLIWNYLNKVFIFFGFLHTADNVNAKVNCYLFACRMGPPPTVTTVKSLSSCLSKMICVFRNLLQFSFKQNFFVPYISRSPKLAAKMADIGSFRSSNPRKHPYVLLLHLNAILIVYSV